MKQLVALDSGYSISNREPPRAFRIFPKGQFTTEKGTFCFDEGSVRSVMSLASQRGSDCFVDYEHGSIDGRSPHGGAAAAWFDLDVREGELWATNVRWTPRARLALCDGAYKYISPCFDVDPITKRVSGFHNVGLTNSPAMHNAPALVAASRGTQDSTTAPAAVYRESYANPKGDEPMNKRNGYVTSDGVEVPSMAYLSAAGITEEQFIVSGRALIADGTFKPASLTSRNTAASSEVSILSQIARRVQGPNGRSIDVPTPRALSLMGMTETEFIASQTLMMTRGLL